MFVRGEVPAPAGGGWLIARPNPVPRGPAHGTTKIAWGDWDYDTLEVFVSMDAAHEELFASGGGASEAEASWIQAGHTYVFRLYGPGRKLLASVHVTREQ